MTIQKRLRSMAIVCWVATAACMPGGSSSEGDGAPGDECASNDDCDNNCCVEGNGTTWCSFSGTECGGTGTGTGGSSSGGSSSGGSSSGGSSSTGAAGACAYYQASYGRLLCEQRTDAGCPGHFFGPNTSCTTIRCPTSGRDPSQCTIDGSDPNPPTGKIVIYTTDPDGWTPTSPTAWKGGGTGLHTVMTVSVDGAIAGSLTAGKLSSTPSCGATYAITKSLTPGTHSVSGKVYFLKDIYGNTYNPRTFSKTVTVVASACTAVALP